MKQILASNRGNTIVQAADGALWIGSGCASGKGEE